MARLQRFNKIVAIAPSEVLDSDIHINHYGYRIADVFHGYLDPESAEQQVFLMGGYVKALGAKALQPMESLEEIKEILVTGFKIPEESIVLHQGESIGALDSFAAGVEQYSDFFADAKDGKRTMGLVTDRLQMPLGRDALTALDITCAEFPVNSPRFGRVSTLTDVLPPPIALDTYRGNESGLSVAVAGDS